MLSSDLKQGRGQGRGTRKHTQAHHPVQVQTPDMQSVLLRLSQYVRSARRNYSIQPGLSVSRDSDRVSLLRNLFVIVALGRYGEHHDCRD